jgi:hypothetical protein
MTSSRDHGRSGTLASLLESVEAAEGPDREIDSLLWYRLVFDPELAKPGYGWVKTPGIGYSAPAFTASFDQALALYERVLAGWTIAHVGQRDDKSWCAELREGYQTSYGRVAISETRHKTPALALIEAMLEALGARLSDTSHAHDEVPAPSPALPETGR